MQPDRAVPLNRTELGVLISALAREIARQKPKRRETSADFARRMAGLTALQQKLLDEVGLFGRLPGLQPA